MYAKKFGTDSYEEMMQKLMGNPLRALPYAFKTTFSMVGLPFKKTKDSEINLQASKVKKGIYRLIFIFLTLGVVVILYALIYSYILHTTGNN